MLLQNVSRLIFGLIFLVVQHGYHSMIIALIAAVGFAIAMFLKGYKIGGSAFYDIDVDNDFDADNAYNYGKKNHPENNNYSL